MEPGMNLPQNIQEKYQKLEKKKTRVPIDIPREGLDAFLRWRGILLVLTLLVFFFLRVLYRISRVIDTRALRAFWRRLLFRLARLCLAFFHLDSCGRLGAGVLVRRVYAAHHEDGDG
jgi:hypothetical protein